METPATTSNATPMPIAIGRATARESMAVEPTAPQNEDLAGWARRSMEITATPQEIRYRTRATTTAAPPAAPVTARTTSFGVLVPSKNTAPATSASRGL